MLRGRCPIEAISWGWQSVEDRAHLRNATCYISPEIRCIWTSAKAPSSCRIKGEWWKYVTELQCTGFIFSCSFRAYQKGPGTLIINRGYLRPRKHSLDTLQMISYWWGENKLVYRTIPQHNHNHTCFFGQNVLYVSMCSIHIKVKLIKVDQ